MVEMLGREEYADWMFPESPQLLRADNGRLLKMVSELRTDCLIRHRLRRAHPL